mmetsp:Transcript_40999/g.74269  ORF Transcript_40999/g.74269 Transcript_40999/m.74269 type:complete len:250 (+) Transcript_40999:143-892(+)
MLDSAKLRQELPQHLPRDLQFGKSQASIPKRCAHSTKLSRFRTWCWASRRARPATRAELSRWAVLKSWRAKEGHFSSCQIQSITGLQRLPRMQNERLDLWLGGFTRPFVTVYEPGRASMAVPPAFPEALQVMLRSLLQSTTVLDLLATLASQVWQSLQVTSTPVATWLARIISGCSTLSSVAASDTCNACLASPCLEPTYLRAFITQCALSIAPCTCRSGSTQGMSVQERDEESTSSGFCTGLTRILSA